MAETNNKLNQLLQRIAVDENIDHPDIQVKVISTGGANFASNLYLANITDKANTKSLKLFAKIAAINEVNREKFSGGSFEAYNIERIAYSNLFQVYRQIEEKFGLAEEVYYGSDSTHLQETIVLEDLGSRGFELYSRFKSVDWPYASSAITELAKFHALSFAFQHEKPNEFNKVVEDFQPFIFPDDEETKATYNHVSQLAINSVHEKNKDKLKKLLDGQSMTAFNYHPKVLRHLVLIHGDFRPSNMMYRKRHNGSTEVMPVDYQTIQGGCPMADLVYFIVCGTDGPFRARHYPALAEHYYSELGAALARLGLHVDKVYPREDFEFELKQKLPYGLIISVIGLPILTTPEDQAQKAGDFNINVGLTAKTGDMYQTRLNEIVDDYVTWGVLVD